MNSLILEDEKSSALRLSKLIRANNLNKKFDLHFATTINEAKSIIKDIDIELLFLDLQLANEDGFRILQEFTAERLLTIVVSAYTERAIEAYEYGVLDFISKPVFQERLDKSLEKVFGNERFNSQTKRISIKNRNKIETISVKDIIYLQPADHYTEIILANGLKKLHHLPLDKLIKILPNNFERTHRSYIVNIEFISKIYSYAGSKYEIELYNSEKLALGRTYAKSIKSLLNQN